MHDLALETILIMAPKAQLRRRLLEQFCLIRLMRVVAFGAGTCLHRLMNLLFCGVGLFVAGVTQLGLVRGCRLERVLVGFDRLVAFHAGSAVGRRRMDMLLLEKITVACPGAGRAWIDLDGRLGKGTMRKGG